MPHLCGSQTQTGGTCNRRVMQDGAKCPVHRVREEQCAICIADLTGPVKILPCGHEYHRRCILAWRRRGENTCPLCRAPFTDPIPNYKVTIVVENVRSQRSVRFTSNVLPDLVSQMNIVTDDALVTEVVIDVHARDALIEVLHDLGIQTLPDPF